MIPYHIVQLAAYVKNTRQSQFVLILAYIPPFYYHIWISLINASNFTFENWIITPFQYFNTLDKSFIIYSIADV